jgi:hypothetical protein
MVCGLPINSTDFGTLPPHFRERSDAVRRALASCFSNSPSALSRVLEFCLASLVYHRKYLRDTLPATSPLFATPLFSTTGLLDELAPLVICRAGTATDAFPATGLPAHTALLLQSAEISRSLEAVIPEMRAIGPAVVTGVVKELNDRAIGAGTVTRDGLQELLETVVASKLRDAGVGRVLQLLESRTDRQLPVAGPPDREPSDPDYPYALHTWGGGLHRVPESFRFPKCSPRSAFILYCCGSAEHRYPPLRLLDPSDMKDRNQRKRLSDYLFLMRKLKARLEQLGQWVAHPTVENANEMYDAAANAIETSAVTGMKRKRRTTQLKWISIVSLLRKKQHHDEGDAAAHPDGDEDDGDGSGDGDD